LQFPHSKIVALNVQRGGGYRVAAICEFLDRHDPDVVVLTEWTNGAKGRKIVEWAESRGLVHDEIADGGSANGVLIASHAPFKAVSATALGATSAGVLLQASFEGWALLACYFPQGEFKTKFFSACAQASKELADHPFVIIGDLNTGNQLADKTPTGAPFACNRQFDALTADSRLIDLWRHTNGADAREWSWRTTKNGFRIDHAFANDPFLKMFQSSCEL
jgi:exonuclease III